MGNSVLKARFKKEFIGLIIHGRYWADGEIQYTIRKN
jgi:hypothetical protein